MFIPELTFHVDELNDRAALVMGGASFAYVEDGLLGAAAGGGGSGASGGGGRVSGVVAEEQSRKRNHAGKRNSAPKRKTARLPIIISLLQ
jgi:hypothetical protein